MDWLFSGENYICNFRSAGVLIRNNKILLQRDKEGLEYALPGGHVKIGEYSIEFAKAKTVSTGYRGKFKEWGERGLWKT
ncbi:MAG: hypothetical protein GX345_05605 [Clostridiales bacterium]|nr:hypothetical protein [Clostridiales bacterium]